MTADDRAYLHGAGLRVRVAPMRRWISQRSPLSWPRCRACRSAASNAAGGPPGR